MSKKNLGDLTRKELKELLEDTGHPSYRSDQIFQWIYARGVASFDEMTNVPAAMREQLSAEYNVLPLRIDEESVFVSDDGVTKNLVTLSDDETVESVVIPSSRRLTVCVSTQVGCRFGCAFCASGKSGFVRNLSPGEIAGQVLLAKQPEKDVTNVVFMGVGEPLDNYANLVKAIHIIHDEKGLNVGARKMTVSTCGLSERIRDMAKLGLQIELAISLHAPNDKLRRKLVPAARKWPIADLMNSCLVYSQATKRKITLEYALIDGLNDTRECASQLADLSRSIRGRVNLIPLNVMERSALRPSRNMEQFSSWLESAGVPVTVRRSRGGDIRAACGQLRAGI